MRQSLFAAAATGTLMAAPPASAQVYFGGDRGGVEFGIGPRRDHQWDDHAWRGAGVVTALPASVVLCGSASRHHAGAWSSGRIVSATDAFARGMAAPSVSPAGPLPGEAILASPAQLKGGTWGMHRS
jgi:hypothetical protein